MQTSQQLNKSKIFSRASLRQRLIAGSLFLAVVAFFGLFAFAAHYKIALWPYPCGFKQDYSLPCLTCGVTTSVLTFARGQILRSFYIQPAAAFFCSMLAVSVFFTFFTAVFGLYFTFIKRFFAEVKTKHLILALIIIIAAAWAVTLARALAINF
jgi:hypothetical protein